MKRRIFVVDDHPIVRGGLIQLISEEADLEVCGQAGEAETALAEIEKLRPDLALVDISLEGRDGLDLLKDLQLRIKEMPVLVLSMHDELMYAERALRAGARGYIMKQEATEKLLDAIRKVLEGKIYVGEKLASRMLEKLLCGKARNEGVGVELLSDRELEVFRMYGHGYSSREIAERLCLSIKTIETYRAKIKDKLSLRSGAEMVKRAVQWVELEGP